MSKILSSFRVNFQTTKQNRRKTHRKNRVTRSFILLKSLKLYNLFYNISPEINMIIFRQINSFLPEDADWIKLPLFPCLELVRIMLKTYNLARKYTTISSFKKYNFQYLGPLNFAGVSIFCKKSAFFGKKYLYSKEQCESCVRDILILFCFCKIKHHC